MKLMLPWVKTTMQKNRDKQKNEVQDYQHTTATEQIHFTPGGQNDKSTMSTRTARSSTSNPKSSESVTHNSKNIVTKTSYPVQNDIIDPRERNETHGNKSQYEGSENSHIEHSHGEKCIQVYKGISELSNK